MKRTPFDAAEQAEEARQHVLDEYHALREDMRSMSIDERAEYLPRLNQLSRRAHWLYSYTVACYERVRLRPSELH